MLELRAYLPETAMPAFALTGLPTAPTLRRVRKAEAAQPAFDKPDPYAILMACWVDYMNTDDRDLGAGRMRLNGEVIDELDVYEQQRAADLKMGAAVNAMVDSLTMQHRWAIYRSQGISTAWRFQNANYVDVLEAARAGLELKLKNNVATKIYFE
jgi:hypothetical protein